MRMMHPSLYVDMEEGGNKTLNKARNIIPIIIRYRILAFRLWYLPI